MATRSFDVAVLGGGPAGMIAALCMARTGDVALVVDGLPDVNRVDRVDTVPARSLASLVELGIGPHAFGVSSLHDERWVAWSDPVPRRARVASVAHVERPRFDAVLFSHVVRHARIAVFASRAWTRGDGRFWGDGWSARRLVDATGRASATAEVVIRAPHPWAARTFWTVRRRCSAGPAFAVAAHPSGYAYRVASEEHAVIAFVGRGSAVEGTAGDLERTLRTCSAAWLLTGMPSLDTFAEGRSSTASVQWTKSGRYTDPGAPIPIGDAALARDPLSSQGLAAACSDAHCAAAVADASDVALFEARRREQRDGHLATLSSLIASCRLAAEPAWRVYAEFVAEHVSPASAADRVAVRDGRLVTVARSDEGVTLAG
jgi:2-polyprenyl-6-methoxyphenol hydroxylase-like FAD-dependent oxidoreductase